MITLTFAGSPAVLITEPPDWQQAVSASFSLDAGREEGLSNRETRRAYSQYPRVTALKWRAWVNAVAARTLIYGMRQGRPTHALAPFWPAVTTWGARASSPIQGGLLVVYTSTWSHYAIYSAGAEPSWPDGSGWTPSASDNWAPVLEGNFPNDNPLSWINDDLAQVDFELQEDGPLSSAILFPSTSWAQGPLPSGSWSVAPDLFPFAAQWADAVGETYTIKVSRTREGFGHAQATTFYNQAVARLNETSYLLTSPALIGQFLRWWQDHGAGAATWIPGRISAARLTANIGSADTSISVDSSSGLAVGDWLGIYDAAGNLYATQVQSVGSGTAGISPALGYNVAALGSTVAPLLLARHDEPTLDVEWTHTGLATARIKFKELPPEYTPDAAETLGATLGLLAARAILLEITTAGATTYWTNYEDAVTYGGNTYQPALFSHGDIRESLNLERTDVQVTIPNFTTSHPLAPLFNLTSEDMPVVVIKWCGFAPPAPPANSFLKLTAGGYVHLVSGGYLKLHA